MSKQNKRCAALRAALNKIFKFCKKLEHINYNIFNKFLDFLKNFGSKYANFGLKNRLKKPFLGQNLHK